MGAIWSAYEYQPSFMLGFHGCDESVGEKILRGEEAHLRPSEKKYDWLGHGIYFWEGNPSRALQWAQNRQLQAGSTIRIPFVLGAIIDLKRCLDLFDQDGLEQVRHVHKQLDRASKKAGIPLPRNVGRTPDKVGRERDCTTMNALHEFRHSAALPTYDSIRGPFLEGPRLYPRAGFRSQNHIQLCVRNLDCIKGYFRPILAR